MLTVRVLATIVTSAAAARADCGVLLAAVLHHGLAETLLSVLETPQLHRSSLALVSATLALSRLSACMENPSAAEPGRCGLCIG